MRGSDRLQVNAGFTKITPCNGFDCANPDNGKQNNYAWSMADMGGYLYVGTGRNITYSVFKSGLFGPIEPPAVLVPENLDMNGEIWRYRQDGSQGWERVFKSTDDLAILGLRSMIRYTTPTGETALYAGSARLLPGVVILKSTDGVNWTPLPILGEGSSTRAMAVHDGRLYVVILPGSEFTESRPVLYASTDPEREGWTQIDLEGAEGENPRGNADTLISYNGHLYMGTSRHGGFELWRTKGAIPAKDDWQLVVDKGAGDALNEFALTLGVFDDLLYVGTALFGIRSLGPEDGFVLPKGFDLVRVRPDDSWELVIGGPPLIPTEPTTGERGQSLSGLPSGFGDVTNAYCWQLQAYGGQLYLATFSWSDLVQHLLPEITEALPGIIPYDVGNVGEALGAYLAYLMQQNPVLSMIPIEQILAQAPEVLLRLIEETAGFDLWKSPNGVNWSPVSTDGLGNPNNYGGRTLLASDDGSLYLGTANPFQGCEVWVHTSA